MDLRLVADGDDDTVIRFVRIINGPFPRANG